MWGLWFSSFVECWVVVSLCFSFVDGAVLYEETTAMLQQSVKTIKISPPRLLPEAPQKLP